MEKTSEVGQKSAAGSFQLFVGKTFSTLILAVSTIILGSIIDEEAYGLFVVALIPSATLLLFHNWGIGAALTRNCAQLRASNCIGTLRRTIIAGLTFQIGIGSILTVTSLLTANVFAFKVFAQPQSEFLIVVGSAIIISTSLFNGVQSVIIGFEKMQFISYALICQAVVQGVLSPVLVFLGLGAMGALLGYALGWIAACLIAVMFLYFGILRKLPRVESNEGLAQTLTPLLRYGIPFAFSVILTGLLTQFYSFMMAAYVSDLAMIGNYKIAMNFAVLLTLFTVPISTVLFPAFSKINPISETSALRSVFSYATKYAALLLVPATVALIVLSEPLIGTLYGGKWSYAPPFLALSLVSNLMVVFGSFSVSGLLPAVGETKLLLKLSLLSLAIGVPLAFLLVPLLGINGVILGALLSIVPSTALGVYLVDKRYEARADFRSSGKIVVATAIAAVVVSLFLGVFDFVAWIKFGGGILLFLLTYLVSVPLVGAVSRADIDNLRRMFSGLGIVSRIVEFPLVIMEKVLDARIPVLGARDAQKP